MDLPAGLHLLPGKDAVLGKQGHILLRGVDRQGVGGGGEVGQPAAGGLLEPGVLIAVAVEDDPLMLGEHPADEGGQGLVEVVRPLQLIGKLLQLLGHDGVQGNVGAGNGLGGAQHPELKLVAGEGHGGGAVPVGVVLGDGGHHVHPHPQGLLAGVGVLGAVDDGLHHGGELVAQEDGHHGGRGLLGPQAVVVAREGHGGAQEVLILVHALHKGSQKQQEAGVLAGGAARLEQVVAGIGGQGPVVMLARAVDAGKGLLMEQAHQAVLPGHLLHHVHGDLVVVAGGVGVGVDGGHLMLTGGHLVVLGLGQDPQLPQLPVQVLHVGGHPGPDGAEVVVLQLLALGGGGAEQSAAAQAQVHALGEVLLVNEEILLLGAHLGGDPLGLGIPKQAQDAHRLAAHLVHGPQQGGLFIQHLAGVGVKHGGDIQGVVPQEGVGGGVPGGVAPGLEGGPQAAGGEGGGVGLAPDQLLAGELQQNLAAGGGGDEAVVLLCGVAGHRLEPVGEMGGAPLNGPVLHGVGNVVGDGQIQSGLIFNALLPGAEGIGGEVLPHRVLVEDHASKQLGEICGFRFHRAFSFHFIPQAGESVS